jgi:hypothetical protein
MQRLLFMPIPHLVRNAALTSLALGILALTLPARAADVEVRAPADTSVRVRHAPALRFGEKGQKAISSDVGLSLSNTSVSGVSGSSSVLVLRPALDFFVAVSWSVGGFLGVEYASAPGGSSTSVSIGPRVGYNAELSNRLSIWPKVGLAVARTSQTDEGAVLPGGGGVVVGQNSEANTSVQLNLFVPIMFHPVDHFFLGLGPALDQDLSGDSKATVVAVRLASGGWS